LRAIAALALEVPERPELLSDFVAVVKLVPKTIAGLEAAAAWVHRDRMRCVTALDLLQ
jgi:hypothetical protein